MTSILIFSTNNIICKLIRRDCMEIALVDDMNYDRDKLYQIISYYLNIKNIDCTIYTYSSAEEFLKDFFKHKFIMVF